MQGPEVATSIIMLRHAVPRLLDPAQVPSSVLCPVQFDFSLVDALAAENITAFERVQLQCLRVRARRYGIRERADGTVQERFGS
jgi:hypothetical protein